VVAATNFLWFENVARARRKFKKTAAKKKYGRRRRDEGEKKFSARDQQERGKVLHSYSGLLNNVTPLLFPLVNK